MCVSDILSACGTRSGAGRFDVVIGRCKPIVTNSFDPAPLDRSNSLGCVHHFQNENFEADRASRTDESHLQLLSAHFRKIHAVQTHEAC